jgi:predicted O-methyltransferase YrrM
MKEVLEVFKSLPNAVVAEMTRRSTLAIPYLCETIASNQIKTLVEVGTFKGKTAIAMACVVKRFGGMVHTINVNNQELDVARKFAEMAGVAEHINFIHGDSLRVLPKILPDMEFGLMFVDGFHDYTHSMRECKLGSEYIDKECGVIFIDDAGGMHVEGRHDGGVPRTIKETGAEVVSTNGTIVGRLAFGGVFLPRLEVEWSI